LLDRAAARHTLVHVIFEEQPARLREVFAEIVRDERLEIFTALQSVPAECGGGRTGERTPNPLTSPGNQLVVHVFVSNLRE
jgi:hypothetical protein